MNKIFHFYVIYLNFYIQVILGQILESNNLINKYLYPPSERLLKHIHHMRLASYLLVHNI